MTAPSKTKEYSSWVNMRGRCLRPGSHKYKNYGARGIRICPQWENNFSAFLSDVGHAPSPKHSIDRIDNDGNYEPGNVRWASPSEQSRNCRSNHYVSLGGRTMTLSEACAECGHLPSKVANRLRHGWALEDALECPGAFQVRAPIIRPTGPKKCIGLPPHLERMMLIILAAYPSPILKEEVYAPWLSSRVKLGLAVDLNRLIARGFADRVGRDRVVAKQGLALIAIIEVKIPLDMSDAETLAKATKAVDAIMAGLPAGSKIEFASRALGKMGA